MKPRILVFDDMPENREEVLDALKRALRTMGSAHAFAAGVGGRKEGTYEDRLTADLRKGPNSPVSLIVADRDLSADDPYRGLSEATVRRAADVLGIPECGYARGERADDAEYIQRGEQREACIRLSLKPTVKLFAQQAVAVAEGFLAIFNRVARLRANSGKGSAGDLLADILGKPEYAEKISLFATGDRNRLEALSALRASKNKSEHSKRLSCLLGYWLWDSVLRFPGVVVDDVGASSYLDILEEDFKKNDRIQALFARAQYSGPFAGAKPALWWRAMLDDIVASKGLAKGREYAEKQLRQTVRRSKCCEDSSKSAGYYCFLSGRPVSLDNSKPGLPWFPRGADLARVSKSKCDELGPWLWTR